MRDAATGAASLAKEGVETDLRGLELKEQAGGTRLRLRVRPGSRRSALLGAHGGALKLGVTAAPERGRANRAVLDLLGEALGVAPSTLALLSGAASADKVVLVPLSPATVAERLARFAG